MFEATVCEFQNFKNMFVIPEWPDCPPAWTNEALNLLLEDISATEPQNTTLAVIQQRSKKFPIVFPVQTVRCETLSNLASREVLERNINSAYPVLHENVLALCANFLLYKRKYGHRPEKKLYANMSLLGLIQRLLTKKAALFINIDDIYCLMDHTHGIGNWEIIGTNAEGGKLNLRDCLSYDEIKLSAFLSISSYSSFINDGNRYNEGKINREGVETEGIVIGLIGARLGRPQVMDYQEVIITEDQNHESNGYGLQAVPTLPTLFSRFYGEACFTYRQVIEQKKKEPSRFVSLCEEAIFDNKVYCKRITLSIDTLLLIANQRAKEKGTMAFVHVVGIGLGVWRIATHQNSLFMDTFTKRLQILSKMLHSVSDVVLAYIDESETTGGPKNGNMMPIARHPNGGIKIQICNREPHMELTGEDRGKLLVVSYAGDGNALPGNEFWFGTLDSSGDSAAAASTQISEIHNPHINPKVCAENLRIATLNGVVPFFKYRETYKLANK